MKKKLLSILCIILMFSIYITPGVVIALSEETNSEESKSIQENINEVNNTKETNEVEENKYEVQKDNEYEENKTVDNAKEIQDEDNNVESKAENEIEENETREQLTENLETPNTQDENKIEEQNQAEYMENSLLKIALPVPTKTIENGTYIIYSAVGSSMVLDVSAGSKEDGANVQIWKESNVKQQRFKVTNLGDGYYSIVCVNSKKALDVAWAGTENRTNVWQHEDNGTDAQKWIIQDAGDGYYNIISKCNGLYLDVANAGTSNGTNVQVYEGNKTDGQKFRFEKVKPLTGSQTIKDGVYIIKSALSNSKALDISNASTDLYANVQLWDNNGTNAQKFIIKYVGSGFYTVENLNSKKVLDVANAGQDNGTRVWQYQDNGTDAQKWVIQDAGNGYYNIISKCNELYLDVQYGFTANGTKIQTYESNGTNSQKFKFEETELCAGQTISNGTYIIESKLSTNKVLDISGGSSLNGANLQLWDNAKEKQQKFIVTYLGNCFYKIQNLRSGKVLDVANAGTSNGTNVWQYTSNNTNAQEWVIKDCGNGYYSIISRCNGLYLDVAWGATGNGTNIQVHEGNGTNAQQFKFIKAETDGIDVSQYNGKINWNQVKNSNIDFAFIRLGYRGYGTGGFVQDSRFTENIESCIENQIDCGVYFVTQAINYEEGVEEANYTLEKIKGYNVVCPIVIDVEDSAGNPGRADDLTKEERTQAIKGFCDTIRDAGYIPMIYTSKSWLENKIDLLPLSYCSIWLAHYVSGAPEKTSDYKGDYLYWQYTSSGAVNGITGYVDLNKGY